MKKIAIILTLAAIHSSAFAQMNDSTYRSTVKNEFLRKSKNQRTTGFILAGTGVALLLTGAIIVSNADDDILNPGNWVDGASGAGLFTVGGLATLTSIPFFIMSASNNKKAKQMSAGISFEKLMNNKIRTLHPNYYPALTARLNF